jgi:PTS system mannose-specific IIA component
MSEVLVVTHGTFGASLLESASEILGRPKGAQALGLPLREGADDLARWVGEALGRAEPEGGLLILVDFAGGTPDNVCRRLSQGRKAAVVAGLNLPMLIQALSGRELPLAQQAEKCVKAGQAGVKVSTCP